MKWWQRPHIAHGLDILLAPGTAGAAAVLRLVRQLNIGHLPICRRILCESAFSRW